MLVQPDPAHPSLNEWTCAAPSWQVVQKKDKKMKKFNTSALAVFITLAAGSAFAANTTHTVKSVDEKTHTVMLENGNAYIFKATYDLTKVKVGEKVDITYETKNGKHEATALKAAM